MLKNHWLESSETLDLFYVSQYCFSTSLILSTVSGMCLYLVAPPPYIWLFFNLLQSRFSLEICPSHAYKVTSDLHFTQVELNSHS